MPDVVHPVVTEIYPENQTNGIMICGINFGISKQEDFLMVTGGRVQTEPPSFFSDQAVRKTDKFNRKIIGWLSSWGFFLAREKGSEGNFERSFFQTNWLNTQTENAKLEGKNLNLIRNAEGFLSLLKERKPSVILFFGKDLLEAFNDTQKLENLGGRSVRDVAESILGNRSGNPKRHEATRPDGTRVRNHLLFQKFGNTQIISLPHPMSRAGIKDEDIKLLKPPLHALSNLFKKISRDLELSFPTEEYPEQVHPPKEVGGKSGEFDPLFEEAKLYFLGITPSVSEIQKKWRLGYARAVAIKEAIINIPRPSV